MSDWVTLKDALALTLRPIDEWPGKLRSSWQRERAPYSAPLKDTLRVLKRELGELRASRIILQIAIREGQLRLDGLPRPGATAEHPGVILAFDSRHGAMRFAFDRFSRWEYNLRAIALSLEHLRLANLYGVANDGQQYRGWQALPPPPRAGSAASEYAGAASLIDAARVLLKTAGLKSDAAACGELVDGRTKPETVFRQAAAKAHPDAGGSHEAFLAVQRARELIEAYWGRNL